ncbi:oxidoreductase [Candidatus Woesearchaeota archaeon CG10_big_fil_rev_8_21_14_0_10_45_16]|nr:MAG: oxidoreductase [Candidatus Woesearchaeota archaeon CG10_big_fil_rev_8_21_14_0_10_45_16]
MIRIGVIGVGSMGQNHARVYADCENAELVAVADPQPEQLQRVAHKFNAVPYQSYLEMLEKENLDAVSISVPTSLHKKVAIEALSRGKHVLLEKPIAETEEEAREIIDCAKINNVKLMIGHIERFNPAILHLKELLEQGELGEIYKIDVQRIGPFPSRIADVGVIIDLSVHDLDIINYLTDKKPCRVYAEVQQKLHPSHEDSVTALLSYDDEMLAVLNVNYLSPTKIRQLKIFGKRGMFSVDYLSQELCFFENHSFKSENWESVSEGDMKKIHLPKKEPLKAEIEAFLKSIEEDSQPPVSGEQGLLALQTANHIILSAKERSIVRVL